MRYSKDDLIGLANRITGFKAHADALRWCADNIEGIAKREHLPDIRPSMTGKTSVQGHEFYITVGFFDDDRDIARPAEIFLKAAKHGSDVSLFVDAWAMMISLALQYGADWPKIVQKHLHTRGATNDAENPSFLHAIMVAADALVQNYRDDLKARAQDRRDMQHGEPLPQSSDVPLQVPDASGVALQPAPPPEGREAGGSQGVASEVA